MRGKKSPKSRPAAKKATKGRGKVLPGIAGMIQQEREAKERGEIPLSQSLSRNVDPIPAISEEKIIEAFDLLGITSKLKDERTKKLFIAVAKEFRLNPLKRQIHAVMMGGDEGEGGTLVPVVGYEVYIERAEATGRLEWWDSKEEGQVNRSDWRASDYAVTVTIKRRDQPNPFHWKVFYTEAVAVKWANGKAVPNRMWDKRPFFMTKKAAIGQAFRLCFREVLLGMPYVDAEIDSQDEREPPLPPEPQAKPGIKTDEHGKKVEDPEPIQRSGEAIRTVTPEPIDAKQAKANLQRCLNEMGQIYSSAWEPVFDNDGDPVISETMARRMFPDRAPFNTLFTDSELEKFVQDVKNAKDAEAYVNKLIDFKAALAERKVDLKVKGAK